MSGTDSEELSIARASVDAAVRQYVRVHAQERGIDPSSVFVTGWSGFAEYITPDYVQNDQSGNVVIVPDDQNAATSRGLFEFGADAFSRIR